MLPCALMVDMRDLTKNPNADPSRSDAQEVEKAVDAILRKLQRGRTVRLPGIGSLMPGAPPRFQPLAAAKTAAQKESGDAKGGNAKR